MPDCQQGALVLYTHRESLLIAELGYLSLLFSPPLSWPIAGLYVVHRWHQKVEPNT